MNLNKAREEIKHCKQYLDTWVSMCNDYVDHAPLTAEFLKAAGPEYFQDRNVETGRKLASFMDLLGIKEISFKGIDVLLLAFIHWAETGLREDENTFQSLSSVKIQAKNSTKLITEYHDANYLLEEDAPIPQAITIPLLVLKLYELMRVVDQLPEKEREKEREYIASRVLNIL